MHITQKWWRWALGMAALVLLFVCLTINPLWLWQTQAADGDFQSNVESIYYSPMITDTIEIKQSFRPIVSYLEEISVYFYPCGEKHGNLTVTLEKEAAIVWEERINTKDCLDWQLTSIQVNQYVTTGQEYQLTITGDECASGVGMVTAEQLESTRRSTINQNEVEGTWYIIFSGKNCTWLLVALIVVMAICIGIGFFFDTPWLIRFRGCARRHLMTIIYLTFLATLFVLYFSFKEEEKSQWMLLLLLFLVCIENILWLFTDKRFEALYVRCHLKYMTFLLLPIFGVTILEVSNLNSLSSFSLRIFNENVFIAFLLVLLFWCVFGKMGRTIIAFSSAMFILSLINHFTLILRGTPVMPSDVRSVKTAMNVLGAYGLSITPQFAFLTFAQAMMICLGFRIAKIESKGKKKHQKWIFIFRVAVFFASIVLINVMRISGSPQYDWKLEYYGSGYLVTSVIKARNMKPNRPEGYSLEQVQKCIERWDYQTTSSKVLPDIVLIVNESWYDLSLLADYETDEEVMPFISGLDNTIKGYTVNPIVGTSTSEYEILTSNSCMLMPSSIPFTQFSMKNANSIVSVLEELGYSTFAWHPAPAQNYSREQVYPQLGFDRIWFVEDIEQELELYRWFISDKSSFDILRKAYETRQQNQPAFLYNLTIQNHGGYTQHNEEVAIHIVRGLEDCREEAEEYLSCLNQTDRAFQELITYFGQQENNVIVCMLGDHAPSFAYDLPISNAVDSEEWGMRQLATPFILWANFPLKEQNIGITSMPYVVPLLFEYGGLPLTPYYQFMLNLYREIPVLARTFYIGADGKTHLYGESTKYSDLIRDYMYLEYNNISEKERIQEIFSYNSKGGGE